MNSTTICDFHFVKIKKKIFTKNKQELLTALHYASPFQEKQNYLLS